jgi:hypothetical protein
MCGERFASHPRASGSAMTTSPCGRRTNLPCSRARSRSRSHRLTVPSAASRPRETGRSDARPHINRSARANRAGATISTSLALRYIRQPHGSPAAPRRTRRFAFSVSGGRGSPLRRNSPAPTENSGGRMCLHGTNLFHVPQDAHALRDHLGAIPVSRQNLRFAACSCDLHRHARLRGTVTGVHTPLPSSSSPRLPTRRLARITDIRTKCSCNASRCLPYSLPRRPFIGKRISGFS